MERPERPMVIENPRQRSKDVVRRFHEALNARDLEAMTACLTDDTVFENTFPAPDGARYEGKAAVRSF